MHAFEGQVVYILLVTKQIVELHGGSVSVLSAGEEGQGSTFTVRLPCLVAIEDSSRGNNDDAAAPVSDNRNGDPSPSPLTMSERLLLLSSSSSQQQQQAPPVPVPARIAGTTIPPRRNYLDYNASSFHSPTTVELWTEGKVRLLAYLRPPPSCSV